MKIEVKDLGWNMLMRAVRAMAGKSVLDVGVFDDGPSRNGDSASNAEIALVHEFGSPAQGIPERSFMRSTIDANRQKYHREMQRIADKVLSGAPTTQALNLLGMRAANDMKRTIQGGIPPPLKPETVARKGSAKQLVDTGQLITAITWRLSRVP